MLLSQLLTHCKRLHAHTFSSILMIIASLSSAFSTHSVNYFGALSITLALFFHTTSSLCSSFMSISSSSCTSTRVCHRLKCQLSFPTRLFLLNRLILLTETTLISFDLFVIVLSEHDHALAKRYVVLSVQIDTCALGQLCRLRIRDRLLKGDNRTFCAVWVYADDLQVCLFVYRRVVRA